MSRIDNRAYYKVATLRPTMSDEATTRGDGEQSPDIDHPCYVVKNTMYARLNWSHSWVVGEPTMKNGKARYTTYKVCAKCGEKGNSLKW